MMGRKSYVISVNDSLHGLETVQDGDIVTTKSEQEVVWALSDVDTASDPDWP